MEKGKWKGYTEGHVYPISQLSDFLEEAIGRSGRQRGG